MATAVPPLSTAASSGQLQKWQAIAAEQMQAILGKARPVACVIGAR